jgi:hypothetical protein
MRNLFPYQIFMSSNQEEGDGWSMCYVVGERTVAYVGLVAKPEGKRPHGRPWSKGEVYITMHVEEIFREGMDWSDPAQDKEKWRAVKNTVFDI